MQGRRASPAPFFLFCAVLLAGLAGGLAAAPAAAAAPSLSEPARWLQGYLRIDSSNPPGREQRAAAYLAGILRREGIETRILTTPEGRANLWARLPAARPAGGGAAGALLLLHHLDTVPPGPGWSVPPFAGLVRDGRLWGRGAVDDKSLGIAHLAAMVDLKRRRVPLARDLVLLAVADEESGGGRGTAWLLAAHPQLFAGVAAALGEGGRNQQVNGRLLWWGVEVAQKRPLWLEVEARGRGGHASGLNPGSAGHRLIEALARLLALPPAWRVTPPARRYLAALAPLHGGRLRAAMRGAERAIAAGGPPTGLPPGMANLFLDTVQVTVLAAGQRINVTPARARAQVDGRLLPDTPAAEFLRRARAALGDGVATRVLLSSPPSPASPTTTPLYRLLERTLGREAPVVPAFVPGFTDSRYLRQRGVPTYGLSPFALEPGDTAGIHGPDERIPLAELDRGVERTRAVVTAFVSAGPKR
ncbi:MAG TPA: M20/M25/M40 family metallo-hydrolase [Thermoanaerobaculia bacterium]|nr:M20/M25/M40 family metallo-hydrolase [Thermoanaerobaculia bacterium]